MNKRIVYTRPDGGVSIVVPAPKARLEDETDDEFIARIRAKVVPVDATDVAECDAAELPTDRTFRDAWMRGAGKPVDVNMPKARDIHMQRIRHARDNHPDWKTIDRDRAVAQERGDAVLMQDVFNRAQKLRDIPQQVAGEINAASTPEQLKAVWPTELGEKPYAG